MKKFLIVLLSIAFLIFVEVNCEENFEDPGNLDENNTTNRTDINTTGLNDAEIEIAKNNPPMPSSYGIDGKEFQAVYLPSPQYGQSGDVTANGRNGDPDPSNTQIHFNVIEQFKSSEKDFEYKLFGKSYVKSAFNLTIKMKSFTSKSRIRLRLRRLADSQSICKSEELNGSNDLPPSRDVKLGCTGTLNKIGGLCPDFKRMAQGKKKVPFAADNNLLNIDIRQNTAKSYENILTEALNNPDLTYIHIVSSSKPQVSDNKKSLTFNITSYYYNLIRPGTPIIQKENFKLENTKLGTAKILECNADNLKEGTLITCTSKDKIKAITDIGELRFDVSATTNNKELLILNSQDFQNLPTGEEEIKDDESSGLSGGTITSIIITSIVIIFAVVAIVIMLCKVDSEEKNSKTNSTAPEAGINNSQANLNNPQN